VSWLSGVVPSSVDMSKLHIVLTSQTSSTASKPIKNSKDVDYSLVSKNFWAKKIARWVSIHGQVMQKHAPIATSPTENPKPATKIFYFQPELEDLLNP